MAVGTIEVEILPERKRLPTHYPLPILRIGRLAVDTRHQGQGIGKQLLRHSFKLAFQQRDTAGCVGIVIDAKPEAIDFYKRFGFQLIDELLAGEIRGSPPPKPMFLPIKSIPLI
ncbi:hypothetical protein D1AOALGA4SA_1121 [Olavius algarvensis Delta 1 endosymbiont]|nr:hypothetical protein D1AOALGA4SA_1121 [Olavius algarvensis Delta 1 endosymbiont]